MMKKSVDCFFQEIVCEGMKIEGDEESREVCFLFFQLVES